MALANFFDGRMFFACAFSYENMWICALLQSVIFKDETILDVQEETAMTLPPTPAYVRLLNMLNSIRQLAPFNLLSADEGLLLDALIVEWHARDNIMVSELMSDARYGTQATVYRRIIALRDKGLVCLRVDSKDKRVKFVYPSNLAREYMARVGECVGQLERAPQRT